MMNLKEKKIIVIGDRDGVHGEEITSVLIESGHNIIFSTTECFVCTAAGSVDFPTQQKILELVREGKPSDFVVILGACDPEGATVHAETVTIGDPAYVGALAGVQLRLPVYQVFEPEIKDQIDKKAYYESIGIVEASISKEIVNETINVTRRIRQEHSSE